MEKSEKKKGKRKEKQVLWNKQTSKPCTKLFVKSKKEEK